MQVVRLNSPASQSSGAPGRAGGRGLEGTARALVGETRASAAAALVAPASATATARARSPGSDAARRFLLGLGFGFAAALERQACRAGFPPRRLGYEPAREQLVDSLASR